jgi:hypothetical protein
MGPTSAEDLAARYPSETLGLAFHKASAARRTPRPPGGSPTRPDAAVTAYQAPFSAGGGTGPAAARTAKAVIRRVLGARTRYTEP